MSEASASTPVTWLHAPPASPDPTSSCSHGGLLPDGPWDLADLGPSTSDRPRRRSSKPSAGPRFAKLGELLELSAGSGRGNRARASKRRADASGKRPAATSNLASSANGVRAVSTRGPRSSGIPPARYHSRAAWPSRRKEPRAPGATSVAPRTCCRPRAQRVPAVPQPAAAAPGLPDLRHLCRSRGRSLDESPTPARTPPRRVGMPRRARARPSPWTASALEPNGSGVIAEGVLAAAADGIAVRVFGRPRSSALHGCRRGRGDRRPRRDHQRRRPGSAPSAPGRTPRSCAPPPTSPPATPTRRQPRARPARPWPPPPSRCKRLRRASSARRSPSRSPRPVHGRSCSSTSAPTSRSAPQHLVQFAYLGAAFSEAVLGVDAPRVGAALGR